MLNQDEAKREVGNVSEFTVLAIGETLFNSLHLIKAFDIDNKQFNAWSWGQRNLFWSQVIGYIQRFLPAYYAQAFCQRLYSIVEEKNHYAVH